MTGDHSITTINHSTTAFKRYYWAAPSDAAFTINTQPSDTLLGGSGQEILAWEQTGSTIGAGGTEGYADGQVIWTSTTGKTFGIKIHVPVQIFNIGTAPYYQVKTEPNGDWSGEHRSDPYTFEKSVVGFDITARAIAEHQHIHVTVTINDSA